MSLTNDIQETEKYIQSLQSQLKEAREVISQLKHCSVGVIEKTTIGGVECEILKVDGKGNLMQVYPASAYLEKYPKKEGGVGERN